MEQLTPIIAYISLICYGFNMLVDATFESRKPRPYFGYGLISILSTWTIHPDLAILLIMVMVGQVIISCISMYHNFYKPIK